MTPAGRTHLRTQCGELAEHLTAITSVLALRSAG
jgi:hypothetical protein